MTSARRQSAFTPMSALAMAGMLICCIIAAIIMTPSAAHASLPRTDDDSVNLMYRVYNPNSGEHFYTADQHEFYSLTRSGWKGEGYGWAAPKKSNTPVYRIYSGTDHHYTSSASERDDLIKAGWKYEGIGWYSDDTKGVPLYRQFNPGVQPWAAENNSGSHNYTVSKGENDSLVKSGWRAEGIGWYGKSVHWHKWVKVGREIPEGSKRHYNKYECTECHDTYYYNAIA